MIRILIVDDHPIVRRGLKDILSDELTESVFGEAADSQAAEDALNRESWDIVLLDINIPHRDGLELLAEIHRLHKMTKVLMVSAFPEEEFALRAFKLGASGYLCKNQVPEELSVAVKTILQGGKYVTAALSIKLLDALDAASSRKDHESLSNRELQVLRMVAEGKASKEIAQNLSISTKTVETYRARIAAKTGLSTSIELTRYAFQHKLTQ